VCLRLVVEREQDVQGFVPRQFWTLDVKLNAPGGEVQARLAKVKDARIEQLSLEQVEGLTRTLAGAAFWVNHVEQGEEYRQPAPPFTTSSLQQAASKALGLSPDKTMQLAQILYEAGWITYMRTDSVAVAPEAQTAARQVIAQQYGVNYLPEQPPTYPSKIANAQEAHEAIRPVEVARLADSIGTSDAPGAQLYALIWQRFVASQMTAARYSQTTVTIQTGKTLGNPLPLDFQTRVRTLVFDGFLKAYQEALDEGETPEANTSLPPLVNGQTLPFVAWLKEEHTTKAPSRYTEAALIQTLERQGIGRPSTFASMVKLVQDKGYVRLEKKRLVPTPLGMTLCRFLIEHFPVVVDYRFTAALETELDRVAGGDTPRLDVLLRFWEAFDPALKAAGKVVEQAVVARAQPKPTGKACPQCGKPLVERHSARYGPFVGCSNYPQCRFSTTKGRVFTPTAENERRSAP
jgi:DNA topoisomerase-1